jgi:hypothetical protein
MTSPQQPRRDREQPEWYLAGNWLVEDGPQPRFTGYGPPQNAIAAAVGSTMLRQDGGASSTFYVKESSGLPFDGTHKSDQTGAEITKSMGQTLALDAVTPRSRATASWCVRLPRCRAPML